MSKSWQHRPPAAFRLDEAEVIVGRVGPAAGMTGHPVQVIAEPESVPVAITVGDAAGPSRRGLRWGRLFWGASGALLLLALGLAATDLIEGLFARSRELGWLGLAFAMVAAGSLAVIAVRETIGLLRLAAVERLHQHAADIIISDDRIEGRALARELLALTRRTPRLARGRASLEGHLGDIIDGADMVRLVERELMTPLDQEARRLIRAAATRVSVVTALSPRAVIDILFVFGSTLNLVRRLSFLYGVRPGTLGLVRLMRLVILQMAATGGLAASDSLIQQMLGHGITAKLSARLGEGMLNGLLTARLGLAAMDAIRPLPFTALPRPTLGDLMSELVRGYGGSDERQRSPDASVPQSPNS
jgi:putative membrane protein